MMRAQARINVHSVGDCKKEWSVWAAIEIYETIFYCNFTT